MKFETRAKQPIAKHLPMMVAASVLSTAILLSGCSNKDSAEPADDTDATAAVGNDAEADTAGQTLSVTDDSMTANNETAADPAVVSDVINPAAAGDQQPSIVSNPTQAGTPEDTVKQALDTLYYGDVKQAARYYKVDMANFVDELARTQYAFQQTVESVSITNTQYNDDRTRATITGELRLKDQSQPAPLTYELQKINGQWKILG